MIVGERSTAKDYRFVSKIFEKLIISRLNGHLLEIWPFFSNFQFLTSDFRSRSSCSTADLLTVISIELPGLLKVFGYSRCST